MKKKAHLSVQRDLDTFRNKAQKIIAKLDSARTEFRELLSEYEEILDSCDEAADELERAMDTLSQYI